MTELVRLRHGVRVEGKRDSLKNRVLHENEFTFVRHLREEMNGTNEGEIQKIMEQNHRDITNIKTRSK